MKKSIFILALLLGTYGATYAQSFNLGIKAGANFSKLQSDFTSNDNITGYNAGVWARIGLVGFYLQPEAYISTKGNKFLSFKKDNTTVEADGEVKFTNLDIPVLAGMKFGLDKFNVRVMAGPVVSFVLDEKTTFNKVYDEVKDFKNYKNQTIGIQGGVGLDIGSFSIDGRYDAGLSNISKSDEYKQRPNTWLISLGYKIF